MKKIIVAVILILSFLVIKQGAFAEDEIYLADAKSSPGKIFQLLSARSGHPGPFLWPITFIEAYGPNVVWRRSAGNGVHVDGSGRYVFRNLPAGRYRVRADIHADTTAGFDPESRTVNCPTTVRNVNFTYSR